MKKVEIDWLGEKPQVEDFRANIPVAPAPQVPPPAKGFNWWTCGTEGCRLNGYAGTADPTYKRVDCAWCEEQGEYSDFKPEDCPVCGGRGTILEQVPPTCGFCREPLIFLQKGGYPMGYPRSEMPDVPDSEMRGNASMGRVRKIS